MVIFWAWNLQNSKFHLQLSKFLYFSSNVQNFIPDKRQESPNPGSRLHFIRHVIAWAFQNTTLHSMSFRDPELSISKFSIQIQISTLFKINSKTLGLQNCLVFPFYPQDSEFQIFSQENDLDSFNMDFSFELSHFISDSALLSAISKIILLQNRPIEATSFQNFSN